MTTVRDKQLKGKTSHFLHRIQPLGSHDGKGRFCPVVPEERMCGTEAMFTRPIPGL